MDERIGKRIDMQFKEALRAAGLVNPGRTTWSGIAGDGEPVFTIWSHQVHQVDGRFFVWWDHTGDRTENGELFSHRKGHARTFIALAAANLGKPCRAVIVHPKVTEEGSDSVESADYPHPVWSRVVFRAVDEEALQFIAELVSGE